jgi:hypothetical protein
MNGLNSFDLCNNGEFVGNFSYDCYDLLNMLENGPNELEPKDQPTCDVTIKLQPICAETNSKKSSKIVSVVTRPKIPKKPIAKPRGRSREPKIEMNCLDLELQFLNESDEVKAPKFKMPMESQRRSKEAVSADVKKVQPISAAQFYGEREKNVNLELFRRPKKNKPRNRGYNSTKEIPLQDFLEKTKNNLSSGMMKENFINMKKLLVKIQNPNDFPTHNLKLSLYNLETLIADLQTDELNKLDIQKNMFYYYYWAFYTLSQSFSDLGLLKIPYKTYEDYPEVIDLTVEDEVAVKSSTKRQRTESSSSSKYTPSTKSHSKNSKKSKQTEDDKKRIKANEDAMSQLAMRLNKIGVNLNEFDEHRLEKDKTHLIALMSIRIPINDCL